MPNQLLRLTFARALQECVVITIVQQNTLARCYFSGQEFILKKKETDTDVILGREEFGISFSNGYSSSELKSVTSNPRFKRVTSTAKPWYLRNSALSDFLLECKDPATTAVTVDLSVLRTPKGEWKIRANSLPCWAAQLEQSECSCDYSSSGIRRIEL